MNVVSGVCDRRPDGMAFGEPILIIREAAMGGIVEKMRRRDL
jgi:hypothetical protein